MDETDKRTDTRIQVTNPYRSLWLL